MFKTVIRFFLIILTLTIAIQAREINIDKLISTAKTSPNEKRFFTILNYVTSESYKKMDYANYELDIKEEL